MLPVKAFDIKEALKWECKSFRHLSLSEMKNWKLCSSTSDRKLRSHRIFEKSIRNVFRDEN